MFFKGKAKVKGTVGLFIAPNKISVARVVSDTSQMPRLELLETINCEEESKQGSELAALVKKHALKNAPCTVVLGQGSYNLLQVEAPQVKDSELKSALRWQLKELISFPVDEAVIDIFDMPGQNKTGSPKLIYAVAAHKVKIQILVEQVKASGLALKSIDITEMAMRNISSLLPEDEAGAAMLHLAEEQSQISLLRQSEMYLTKGLNINMLLLRPMEESLTGANAETSFEDRTRLDNLILEIQRLFGYYESNFSLPPISSLLVNPTRPELPGFTHHLSSHLGVPVRVLDLNTILEVEAPLDLSQQVEGLLAVGAALGTN